MIFLNALWKREYIYYIWLSMIKYGVLMKMTTTDFISEYPNQRVSRGISQCIFDIHIASVLTTNVFRSLYYHYVTTALWQIYIFNFFKFIWFLQCNASKSVGYHYVQLINTLDVKLCVQVWRLRYLNKRLFNPCSQEIMMFLILYLGSVY